MPGTIFSFTVKRPGYSKYGYPEDEKKNKGASKKKKKSKRKSKLKK